MTRWLLAVFHLLGFGIGLGAVWARAHALRRARGAADLSPVFTADNWWGLSALLSIVPGLIRAFGGFEKGTDYYLGNGLFLAKMGAVAAILALEIRPMITLIAWRRAVRAGSPVALERATAMARTSELQALLLVLALLAATAMARGYGMMSG